MTEPALSPATPADLERLTDLVSHSFGFPLADCAGWFGRAGHENLRAYKRGERVVGGLMEIPMGQFFGGEAVPMLGVAGVAIAPDERGQGLGNRMMTAMLRDARARGFALSTLYGASFTLYRKAGYERAGCFFEHTIDPRNVEVPRERSITMREVPGLPDDVKALYREHARRTPGHLDRGPYIWSRIKEPRGKFTKTFAAYASENDKLEGYVVVSHAMAGGASSVSVVDLVALTDRAARAILRFLIEYKSLATSITWYGAPNGLFMHLFPERHIKTHLEECYMLRVADVVGALEKRGWPKRAGGSLTLEVADASLPENSGRWSVEVENGKARIITSSSTAKADVTVNERGLAALYSGFSDPDTLVRTGWLEANDDTCVTLASWFAGPAPVIADFF